VFLIGWELTMGIPCQLIMLELLLGMLGIRIMPVQMLLVPGILLLLEIRLEMLFRMQLELLLIRLLVMLRIQ